MNSLIEVASEEEAEDADFVVCLRVGVWSPFSDNEFGACSHCGHAIFFRPYMPTLPPKLCVECAFDVIAADGKPPQ